MLGILCVEVNALCTLAKIRKKIIVQNPEALEVSLLEEQRVELPYALGLTERLHQRARSCGECSHAGVWKAVKGRLPFLDWLPKYNPRHALLGDLIAGITVGVMSIPQGECHVLPFLAYAQE